MNSKELREKRMALAKRAQEILDVARADKDRDLSAEEQRNFDACHAEIASLKIKIDTLERQEAVDLELRGSQGLQGGGLQTGGPPDGGTPEQRTAEQATAAHNEAFRTWMVHGMNGLTDEHRQVMASRMGAIPEEVRAMSAGIDTAGGYTVSQGAMAAIESAMSAFAGVRNTRATIIRTITGNEIPMPTSNDTSNSGEMLGENTSGNEQDIAVGSKWLRSYMFTSKMLRVSYVFLRDTGIANVEGWVGSRLGERIGRATGTKFLSGTGNNQPEGLEAGTTLGKTGASQTSATYDDFVDLVFSVNPAYRAQGEFLISDGLLKEVHKLKDGDGRPLWLPGMAQKAPDTILNKPFTVDFSMPTPAASAITAYFGDFSKFMIRDVGIPQMLRLTERYAELLQIAFLLFSSHDSKLLDAGTNPIKYFQQSA